MKKLVIFRTLLLLTPILLALAVTAYGGESRGTEPAKPPAEFSSIKVQPASMEKFTSNIDLPDEMTPNQPPSLTYYIKNTKDYSTAMAVTDMSLCKSPDQKKTCQAFTSMLSKTPSIGTDITDSRIEGKDYGTVFLAGVDSVKWEGVDSLKAFLGGDSQDPPSSAIVLYIYARKGTNLIQAYTPVDACDVAPDDKESDLAFYKKHCVSPQILEKAGAKAKELTDLFRLKK